MIKFIIKKIKKFDVVIDQKLVALDICSKEFIELVIGLFFVLGSSIAFTFLMYILFQ